MFCNINSQKTFDIFKTSLDITLLDRVLTGIGSATNGLLGIFAQTCQ